MLKTLKRIWKTFWDRSDYDLLTEILSNPSNREYFLDVKRDIPLTPGQIHQDAASTLTYANTQDYAIWVQEAWSRIIMTVHKLIRDDLSASEVDFYRGCLSEAMELISISYKAHRILKEKNEAQKET